MAANLHPGEYILVGPIASWTLPSGHNLPRRCFDHILVGLESGELLAERQFCKNSTQDKIDAV